jgi:hypothetical protein
MSYSKAIQTRITSNDGLLTSIAALKSSLSTKLHAELNPHFAANKSLTASQLLALLEALEERLKQTLATLTSTEVTLVQERGEDSQARTELGEAEQTLRSLLISFRTTAFALYHEEDLSPLALGGRISAQPSVLKQRISVILDWLQDNNTSFPQKTLNPFQKNMRLKKSDVLPEFQSAYKALLTAQEKLGSELKETEATLLARNEALETYDKVASSTARSFMGLLDTVGMEEEALRFRPMIRKARRRSPEEPTTAVVEPPVTEESPATS